MGCGERRCLGTGLLGAGMLGAGMQLSNRQRTLRNAGLAKRGFAPWADRTAAPLLRIEGLRKRFGAFAARRSAFAGYLPGRVFCAAWAFRLRQDHVAAPDCRLRTAGRRPHRARRRRSCAGAAVSAAGQHDVSKLRAVSASQCRGQCRFRPQAGGPAQAADRRSRRRHAGAGEARKSRPAQTARIVRRPAPARGLGALPGQAPARPAARRADGGARQEIARRDAIRADGAAAAAWR